MATGFTKNRLEKILSGSLSASENVEQHLSAIDKNEKNIRAFIDIFADDARKKAKEIDAKIKGRTKVGKLAGLTIAVKSNICISGKRATCASKVLENYVAPYNATVIERILAEDAIIIGAANMDEFAAGSDCTNSAFYPTHNPLDHERVPGGSSGGSAAAVSAGFADLALGSDTGGSIRCPASFCGIVGMKSTYGTVSRYGLIDMGMSLDQIGPFACDSSGANLLLSAISGKDKFDQSTYASAEAGSGAHADISKFTIGIPKEFFAGADPEVAKAVKDSIKKLEAKGAKVKEISLPAVKYAVPIYYLTMCAEFSSAMQKYDGLRYGFPANVNQNLVLAVSEAREKSFGKEVKRRVLLGTYITMKEQVDAWYTKAIDARKALSHEFDSAFKQCDVLIGPTMPTLPWKIGEKSNDPLQMYLSDILTVSANLAQIPAASIPCGMSGKLSIGLQIHANKLQEAKIFAIMKALEE
ncbi:Amidase [Candidatus Gugararchaeum adminiculabundum]|nr:Amidase [Candidatus Gugararchaeum adminiculabundum]